MRWNKTSQSAVDNSSIKHLYLHRERIYFISFDDPTFHSFGTSRGCSSAYITRFLKTLFWGPRVVSRNFSRLFSKAITGSPETFFLTVIFIGVRLHVQYFFFQIFFNHRYHHFDSYENFTNLEIRWFQENSEMFIFHRFINYYDFWSFSKVNIGTLISQKLEIYSRFTKMEDFSNKSFLNKIDREWNFRERKMCKIERWKKNNQRLWNPRIS